ncbi:unnamed protein product [Meloidogyne enterolobii]|uniref:Uncharacterized protein n=1 Tax=Meloidogyne enterolobii TaxID=390850 RepID=A0ACB1AEP0_MELEN
MEGFIALLTKKKLNFSVNSYCQYLSFYIIVYFYFQSTSVLYPPLNFFFVNSITAAMKSLETTACLQVSPVFLHSKLDQILRDQFRSTFPDFFPKRLTSIADNLAAPSSIIDFEAIRKTTTNSSTSCTSLVNKQSNVGVTTENLMENEKLEKNVLINGRVVMGGGVGGGSNVVSSSTNESKLSTTSSSTGQIKVEPEGVGGEGFGKNLKNVGESVREGGREIGGGGTAGGKEKDGGMGGGGTILRTTSGTRRPLTTSTSSIEISTSPLKKKLKKEEEAGGGRSPQLDKFKKEKKKEEKQQKLLKKNEGGGINNNSKLTSNYVAGETATTKKLGKNLCVFNF